MGGPRRFDGERLRIGADCNPGKNLKVAVMRGRSRLGDTKRSLTTLFNHLVRQPLQALSIPAVQRHGHEAI